VAHGEWMLDADLVVAAGNSRFKLPEASLGVFVAGGEIGLPSFRSAVQAEMQAQSDFQA